MEEKKRFDWKIVVILAMLGTLVFCLLKIGELSKQYENLSSSLNINYTNLRNSIDSIYSNVDEKLKKEASLLSAVNHSVGKLSSDKKTASIRFSVVPKVISDDMKLSITVDGRTCDLTKRGSSFEGALDVSLFVDNEERPLLTIKTKEGTKTEFLDDIYLSNLYCQFIPSLYANAFGGYSYTDDGAKVDLDLDIDNYLAEESSPSKFISYIIVSEVNGKEATRNDITDDVLKSESLYNIKYSETYQITREDDLKIYVVAEDSLGYIHKALAYSLIQDKYGDAVETIDGGERIYDKDGKLLFGEKY